MVAAKSDVVNELPVPKLVPPVAVAYQFSVPAVALAERVTVPASQRLAGVVPVMTGMTLTVAVTGVRADVQLPLAAST